MTTGTETHSELDLADILKAVATATTIRAGGSASEAETAHLAAIARVIISREVEASEAASLLDAEPIFAARSAEAIGVWGKMLLNGASLLAAWRKLRELEVSVADLQRGLGLKKDEAPHA